MDTSPWVLFISTLMDGNYAHPSGKDTEMREYFTSIFFSRKNCYCWEGIFWDNCSICRCDFGFLLTGDIPPSPGGVPISYTKSFLKVKLTTNCILSWKIPISSSHFHFSYQTLGANKSANYNSYKFWLAIRSGNTNIRKFSCSTRFAKSLQIIVFRYNQLLCRV